MVGAGTVYTTCALFTFGYQRATSSLLTSAPALASPWPVGMISWLRHGQGGEHGSPQALQHCSVLVCAQLLSDANLAPRCWGLRCSQSAPLRAPMGLFQASRPVLLPPSRFKGAIVWGKIAGRSLTLALTLSGMSVSPFISVGLRPGPTAYYLSPFPAQLPFWWSFPSGPHP